MVLSLSPSVLRGTGIQLEPYEERLRTEVQAALDCDPEGWKLFSASGQGEHFDAWWSGFVAQMAAGRGIAYAVRDLGSAAVVGTSSFLNIRPERCCVEIGATFLHPSVRSSRVNPEAKNSEAARGDWRLAASSRTEGCSASERSRWPKSS